MSDEQGRMNFYDGEGKLLYSLEPLEKPVEKTISSYIEVLVQRAVQDEREECAKVLDEMAAADKLSNYYQVAAVKIRERGNQ